MNAHTIHSPGELIATIVAVLGQRPQEEVVAVSVASDGELLTAATVERRRLLGREGPRLARAIAAGADPWTASFIIVSFTRSDVTLGCEAAEVLMSVLDSTSDAVTVWACDGERFFSPGCADHRCCPPGGTAVPWDTVPGRSHVRAGRGEADHGGEPSGVAPACTAHARAIRVLSARAEPRAQARDRQRAARAGDRWWRRRDEDLDQWRRRALAECQGLLGSGADALAAGRVCVSLRDVGVRDALIVGWLGGSAHAVDDVARGRATGEVTAVLDGAMRDPAHAPDSDAAAVAVLRALTRLDAVARDRDRAPLHSLAAVVLWWHGFQDQAWRFAQRALAYDRDYSLAGLVSDVCDAGIRPAWLSGPRS